MPKRTQGSGTTNQFAWEFRYRMHEGGASTMNQITLSGTEFPAEAAARRKLESLVLN
jgi:hypothetical protein